MTRWSISPDPAQVRPGRSCRLALWRRVLPAVSLVAAVTLSAACGVDPEPVAAPDPVVPPTSAPGMIRLTTEQLQHGGVAW